MMTFDSEGGGERAARQTLREIRKRPAVAKRLDCACLQLRFRARGLQRQDAKAQGKLESFFASPRRMNETKNENGCDARPQPDLLPQEKLFARLPVVLRSVKHHAVLFDQHAGVDVVAEAALRSHSLSGFSAVVENA